MTTVKTHLREFVFTDPVPASLKISVLSAEDGVEVYDISFDEPQPVGNLRFVTGFPMKKLLSVNYGAFRLAAIKRFTDRYHNEESKRLTMSIDKFVNYPDKRTVISVINDFYDVIMSHWFPDKSINDFKNQVLEGYQRIDDELFRLFYFACGRNIDFVEKDAY